MPPVSPDGREQAKVSTMISHFILGVHLAAVIYLPEQGELQGCSLMVAPRK